jgi:hypothetical protein
MHLSRRGMTIGASTLVASMCAAGAAHAQTPVVVDGNPTCADLQGGETWRELKVEPVRDGSSTDGRLTVTVDVTGDRDRLDLDWSAPAGVDAVIVKGGSNANVYVFSPQDATAGKDATAPTNPNTGQPYGLSHVTFCYGGADGAASPPPGPAAQGPTTQGQPGGQQPPPQPGGAPAPAPGAGGGGQPGTPGQVRGASGSRPVARTAVLSAPSGCAKTTFRARVRGTAIQRVVFSLGSRTIATVRRVPGRTVYATTVSLKGLPAGTHRITARVRHTDGTTAVRRLTVQRCLRQAAPTFTG